MAIPNITIHHIARINRLPISISKEIIFYAPLMEHLEVTGQVAIGSGSLVRSGDGIVLLRDGFLRSYPTNKPRFQHDTVGMPLGLLIEPQRTNLCPFSFTMDDAAWVKTNLSVTANNAKDPFGTNVADLLTAGIGTPTIIQDLGTIASSPMVYSVYAKLKTGSNNIQLTLDGGTTWTTLQITPEWTRISASQTLADPDVGIKLIGSGGAVWVYGNQLEEAPESSFIPTIDASIASRNADQLSFNILNGLSDANTLCWLLNGVFQSTPSQANIFDSTGILIGITQGIVSHIVKFSRILSANELSIAEHALTSA